MLGEEMVMLRDLSGDWKDAGGDGILRKVEGCW